MYTHACAIPTPHCITAPYTPQVRYTITDQKCVFPATLSNGTVVYDCFSVPSLTDTSSEASSATGQQFCLVSTSSASQPVQCAAPGYRPPPTATATPVGLVRLCVRHIGMLCCILCTILLLNTHCGWHGCHTFKAMCTRVFGPYAFAHFYCGWLCARPIICMRRCRGIVGMHRGHASWACSTYCQQRRRQHITNHVLLQCAGSTQRATNTGANCTFPQFNSFNYWVCGCYSLSNGAEASAASTQSYCIVRGAVCVCVCGFLVMALAGGMVSLCPTACGGGNLCSTNISHQPHLTPTPPHT